jgi:hypothetical protein
MKYFLNKKLKNFTFILFKDNIHIMSQGSAYCNIQVHRYRRKGLPTVHLSIIFYALNLSAITDMVKRLEIVETSRATERISYDTL